MSTTPDSYPMQLGHALGMLRAIKDRIDIGGKLALSDIREIVDRALQYEREQHALILADFEHRHGEPMWHDEAMSQSATALDDAVRVAGVGEELKGITP